MFTDIEGSVRQWEALGAAFEDVLGLHDALVRGCLGRHDGREIKHLGDGFFASFARVSDAVRCGVAIQECLAAAEWPAGVSRLQVRVAVHAGEVRPAGDDFFGPAVNVAARILQAASGGMTLVSEAAVQLAEQELRPEVELVDLGSHRLRDVVRPVSLMLALPPGTPRPPLSSSAPRQPADQHPVAVDEFVGRARGCGVGDLLGQRGEIGLTHRSGWRGQDPSSAAHW